MYLYQTALWSDRRRNSKLASEFAEEFSGQSLHQVLSEYSMPSRLSQKVTPFSAHHQLPTKVQVLVWLLQRRLLMQLHCYVFFTPTMRAPSGGLAPGSRQSTPDSLSATANTASDTSSGQHTDSRPLCHRGTPFGAIVVQCGSLSRSPGVPRYQVLQSSEHMVRGLYFATWHQYLCCNHRSGIRPALA